MSVVLQTRRQIFDLILFDPALRLHPIVALNSRVASKDTVLPVGGGLDGRSPVFVPQGSIVAFHTPALHRRKDLWGEDADVFNPERWSRETPAGYVCRRPK